MNFLYFNTIKTQIITLSTFAIAGFVILGSINAYFDFNKTKVANIERKSLQISSFIQKESLAIESYINSPKSFSEEQFDNFRVTISTLSKDINSSSHSSEILTMIQKIEKSENDLALNFKSVQINVLSL